MKKLFLALTGCVLLLACENKKSEYGDAYDRGYKDSVATTTPEKPTNTQTAIGSDAGINDVTDSVTAEESTTGTAATAQKNNYELGAKLISKSDCLTCHSTERKIVGPSYKEVAQKYEFNDKNIDYLAGKIIKGGAGVWGEVPMQPHPDISKEDAKEMARYVLSLRK